MKSRVALWLIQQICFTATPLLAMQRSTLRIKKTLSLNEIFLEHARRGLRSEFANDILNGAHINTSDTEGRTALHILLYRDDTKSAAALLHMHPDVDRQDRWGKTPLLIAVERCHEKIATSLLLDHYADPSIADNEGTTPLIKATVMGSLTMMEHLIWFGADPNRGSPLIYALSNGDWHSVCILLQMGASTEYLLSRFKEQNYYKDAIFRVYTPYLEPKLLFNRGSETLLRDHIRYLCLAGHTNTLLALYHYAVKSMQMRQLIESVIQEATSSYESITYLGTLIWRFNTLWRTSYREETFTEQAFKRELFKISLALPHSAKKLIVEGWGDEPLIKQLFFDANIHDVASIYRRRPKECARILNVWKTSKTRLLMLRASPYRDLYFHFEHQK